MLTLRCIDLINFIDRLLNTISTLVAILYIQLWVKASVCTEAERQGDSFVYAWSGGTRMRWE